MYPIFQQSQTYITNKGQELVINRSYWTRFDHWIHEVTIAGKSVVKKEVDLLGMIQPGKSNKNTSNRFD